MKGWGLACAVCFGDPNSLLSKGAFWGVVFLIGVVAFVLTSVGMTGWIWSRRAKKLNAGGSLTKP